MRVNGPELWFSRWGWWRRKWQPTPVLLPGKIPWTEAPGRLQSLGSLRVGHDWVTSLSLSFIGEGNGNPLQCSCLENPRDGRAWWAAVYGVAQSWTQLKRLSSSSSRWGWSVDACSEMGQLGFLVWMVRSETEIRDYPRVFGLRSVGMEAPTEMRKLIVWVIITGFIRSFILTILRVWGISGTSKWRHQIGSWTHKLGNWKRGSSGDIQNVVATMGTQVSELWLHLGGIIFTLQS